MFKRLKMILTSFAFLLLSIGVANVSFADVGYTEAQPLQFEEVVFGVDLIAEEMGTDALLEGIVKNSTDFAVGADISLANQITVTWTEFVVPTGVGKTSAAMAVAMESEAALLASLSV